MARQQLPDTKHQEPHLLEIDGVLVCCCPCKNCFKVKFCICSQCEKHDETLSGG